MKILAVSDVVVPHMQDTKFLRKTFEGVGLIVSCGDMPPAYLDIITTTLCVPLFYVRGNHDTNYLSQAPGGDNLHLRFQKFKGFSFLGFEGSIRYNQGPIQYTQGQMLSLALWMLPNLLLRRARYGFGVDVMVAHSPPWGIHDIPDDPAHRGFKAFLYLIRWGRPRYFLHGHVDTWDSRKPTVTTLGPTRIVNVNPYKMLTLEK